MAQADFSKAVSELENHGLITRFEKMKVEKEVAGEMAFRRKHNEYTEAPRYASNSDKLAMLLKAKQLATPGMRSGLSFTAMDIFKDPAVSKDSIRSERQAYIEKLDETGLISGKTQQEQNMVRNLIHSNSFTTQSSA